MKQLEKLIDKAESKQINTLKERTALRTAEIWMIYADWDEQNVDKTQEHYELYEPYREKAREYAEMMPSFQRNAIVEMMDSSISALKSVLAGKSYRLDTPEVDWAEVYVEDDQIIYEGKPVFLADWTWKPEQPEYEEYFGQLDGEYISASSVLNLKGDVDPQLTRRLQSRGDGTFGFVFINHKSTPRWAIEDYPEIEDGPGQIFTLYDINHPVTRRMVSSLIRGTVPYMSGKQYTKMGYMLANEPHWIIGEGEYASSPMSELAFADFKKWLLVKHRDINTLNELWGTSYSSFDAISDLKMISNDLAGTPQYFDLMTYNMERSTEWLQFLHDEVKLSDPEALTHIKIQPRYWCENGRSSGIDMEAITDLTDIIGHDVSSCIAPFGLAPGVWTENYSYNWLEVCMAQDFFKSVKPNAIMCNTESHMLSTSRSRDLNQSPAYVRQNYWMAHIHGLTSHQTWYWARRPDGSGHREQGGDKAYAGTNNYQPLVVNEVHATIADLNSVSDKIMEFQRQRKAIRIFYNEASTINIFTQMESIFSIYEDLCFEGLSIGFATKNIIKKQNNSDWDVIVVASTPYAYREEIEALQSYLNGGGTVVLDRASLLKDEYGRSIEHNLVSSKGQLIIVDDAQAATTKALSIVKSGEHAPGVLLTEDNGTAQKGVSWKVIESDNGGKIINMANFSKNAATISLKWEDGSKINSATDLLTGERYDAEDIELPVYGLAVLVLE
ncbi:MAG: alpha-amylase family protein [Rikenellaceae bacterium]